MREIDNNLVLYHGSDCVVKEPDLNKCKYHKDFGRGFYLSFDEKQAKQFANLVMRRNGSNTKYISVFKLNKIDNLKIFIFNKADEEWFKFVCDNRRHDSKESNLNVDIIVGKIADDATTLVINDYLTDAFGPVGSKKAIKTALGLLLPNRLNDQVCFKTKKAISQLEHITFKDLNNE